MKKILCMLCALALLAGLLAGCGAKADPKADSTTTSAAGETQPANNGGDTTQATTAPPTENGGNDIPAWTDLGNDLSEAFSQLESWNDLWSTDWPENEYTKQVPKPKFATTFGGVTDDSFVAMFAGVDVPQLRDYVKELKQAGFTKNAETTDESAFGLVVYTYKASNGKYTVEVAYAMGMNGITITKD